MYEKKQIIISSYDDLKNPYFAGGGAQAVHQVAKRLANTYRVTVITGKYPGSKNEDIDGVQYLRTGTAFLGAQLDQLTFQLCLPFHVLTKNFDCWIESFTPPFSTSFLQLCTKKPVIGLVHMLSGEDMKRKYKLPFDVIERIGLKTYKSIIVTSDSIKQKIKKIHPTANITVISNGVEKISSEKPDKQQYILFLGRIEVDQKGLDLLINGYAKIMNKSLLPLYIVGSGEQKEEFKLASIMHKVESSKKIVRLARVIGKQKEELLRNAFCVVIPSRFETFSSVAIEAIAHARPIICFDIEGLRWIPENTCVKITPYDENAFANAIVSLDHKKAEKLGRAGQAYAKKFTWDIIAKTYATVIENLL